MTGSNGCDSLLFLPDGTIQGCDGGESHILPHGNDKDAWKDPIRLTHWVPNQCDAAVRYDNNDIGCERRRHVLGKHHNHSAAPRPTVDVVWDTHTMPYLQDHNAQAFPPPEPEPEPPPPTFTPLVFTPR